MKNLSVEACEEIGSLKETRTRRILHSLKEVNWNDLPLVFLKDCMAHLMMMVNCKVWFTRFKIFILIAWVVCFSCDASALLQIKWDY